MNQNPTGDFPRLRNPHEPYPAAPSDPNETYPPAFAIPGQPHELLQGCDLKKDTPLSGHPGLVDALKVVRESLGTAALAALEQHLAEQARNVEEDRKRNEEVLAESEAADLESLREDDRLTLDHENLLEQLETAFADVHDQLESLRGREAVGKFVEANTKRLDALEGHVRQGDEDLVALHGELRSTRAQLAQQREQHRAELDAFTQRVADVEGRLAQFVKGVRGFDRVLRVAGGTLKGQHDQVQTGLGVLVDALASIGGAA